MLRQYWRPFAFGLLIGLVGLLFWHFPFDPTARGADIDNGISVGWLLQLRGERPPPDDVVAIDLARSFEPLRKDPDVGPALITRPEWQRCLNESLNLPTPDTGWPRCAVAVL